jgi:predicted transcriptional regulator YheO
MDKRLQQGLEWLNKEMKKDQKEVEMQKMKMIEEVKKLDKKEIFKPKKKVSIIDKLLKILGYGKKG